MFFHADDDDNDDAVAFWWTLLRWCWYDDYNLDYYGDYFILLIW